KSEKQQLGHTNCNSSYNANVFGPQPPLQLMSYSGSSDALLPSFVQPGIQSGDSFANMLCTMVWNCVGEQRTSCKDMFAVAEAMKSVDRKYQYELVDGWPCAKLTVVTSAAQSKRQKRSA
ncbi:hypothetical protein GGI05_007862, partial [Coemansia sp. RSA 2603]